MLTEQYKNSNDKIRRMKIDLDIEIKTSEFWECDFVVLTDKNGETLHIFNEEAVSFFRSIK